eukprot:6305420-Prymnesium_polylepis.2
MGALRRNASCWTGHRRPGHRLSTSHAVTGYGPYGDGGRGHLARGGAAMPRLGDSIDVGRSNTPGGVRFG